MLLEIELLKIIIIIINKTEAFYINVFLKSSECFLDLFLINTGQELKNTNPKCDKY